MRLYLDLFKFLKLIQERIFKYFNLKRFKGLDFKKGNKMQLLYKIFKSRQLSKKLDYVKLGLFIILKKVIKVIFKLDLLAKIKIYLIQYVLILKLIQGNIKLLLYKKDIYRG